MPHIFNELQLPWAVSLKCRAIEYCALPVLETFYAQPVFLFLLCSFNKVDAVQFIDDFNVKLTTKRFVIVTVIEISTPVVTWSGF